MGTIENDDEGRNRLVEKGEGCFFCRGVAETQMAGKFQTQPSQSRVLLM